MEWSVKEDPTLSRRRDEDEAPETKWIVVSG